MTSGAPPGTPRTLYVAWGSDVEPTAEALEDSIAVTGDWGLDDDGQWQRTRRGSNYLVLAARRGPKRWRLDTVKVDDEEALRLRYDGAWWWGMTWGSR